MAYGNGHGPERLVTLLQVADELGFTGSYDARRAQAMRLVADAGREDALCASWAGTPALPESDARRVAVMLAERRRRAQEHADAERRRQAEQMEREQAARAAAWPTGAEVDTKEGAQVWQATQQRVQQAMRERNGDGAPHEVSGYSKLDLRRTPT